MDINPFLKALKSIAVAPTLKPSKGLLIDLLSDFERDVYQRSFDAVMSETGDESKAILAGEGAVHRFRMGMSYKAKKAESGLVEGWGAMFGSPEVKDTDNIYFHPDTDFLLDYYQRAPLFFEHCQDAQYGVLPIGERVSVVKHAHGLWVAHRLYEEHPLYSKTLQMLEAGELAYSSDTTGHLAIRGLRKDGGAMFWPLVSFALVRSPAEPGLGRVILS